MPFVGSIQATAGFGRAQVITESPTVTSGILLYLDAGNKSSYSGNGTTWFDLTGNNRNATLINAPIYSTQQGGYFSFLDTAFQYATIPNIGNQATWTVEVWTRITASLTGKVTAAVCNQFVSKLNFSIGTNNAPTSYNLAAGLYSGNWRTTTGFTPSLNTWLYVAGTYNGSVINQYLNAGLNTTLNFNGTSQSDGEIRIARRWDDVANNAANFLRGDISIVRIYNRALTQAEITQNYNAQRYRYN